MSSVWRNSILWKNPAISIFLNSCDFKWTYNYSSCCARSEMWWNFKYGSSGWIPYAHRWNKCGYSASIQILLSLFCRDIGRLSAFGLVHCNWSKAMVLRLSFLCTNEFIQYLFSRALKISSSLTVANQYLWNKKDWIIWRKELRRSWFNYWWILYFVNTHSIQERMKLFLFAKRHCNYLMDSKVELWVLIFVFFKKNMFQWFVLK